MITGKISLSLCSSKTKVLFALDQVIRYYTIIAVGKYHNDGVLVDSEPIACDVLAQILTGYGLPTTFDDVVRDFLGGSLQRTREMSESRLGRSLPDGLEDQFHDGLFARFHRLRHKQLLQSTNPSN